MRARGFTIFELLVVIAIVALLIGLLVPVLGRTRHAGRQVKCLANLRSLQIGQLTYCDAYRGRFADVGLPHGGIGDPRLSFIFTLSEFIGTTPREFDPVSPEDYFTPPVLRSPGDASRFWLDREGGQMTTTGGVWRRTSYGMNNYLSRTYNPGISDREPFDRLEKIDRPSLTVQFLLMTEAGEGSGGPGFAVSDHPHVENWGSAAQAPTQSATQVFTSKWGGPVRSVGSISNYSYLDGHAAASRFDRVYLDQRSNSFNPEVAR
jgi:prepilin-type N-terminal cleavage/methylation domain-containing protein/prepilin-type processing-associated H-X9-DG protein